MRGDQLIGHVVGMAGRIADAVQAGDLGQGIGQFGQGRLSPVRPLAVIGVDVLAQQGDFAHAPIRQLSRLFQHRRHRSRPFGAARIGHDAEGAELVATLLHRQEGGRPLGEAGRGQGVELVVRSEVGADPFAPRPRRAGQKLGQLVIGLGTDDDIDGRLTPHDLLALGLGDAAGDGDGQVPAGLAPDIAHLAQLAELGIDLLGRLLADVASVQDDEVGGLHVVGDAITQRAQHIGHALAVIDVHLTAVGLDEQTPFGRRLDLRNQGLGHRGLMIARKRRDKPSVSPHPHRRDRRGPHGG